MFHRDARVRNLYVVDSGVIELRRYTECGSALVLQRANGRSVLAEASIYTEHYHCDAVVTDAGTVLEFSKSKIFEAMEADPKLVRLWGAYLSAAILNARHRAEILSRRSVSDRLDGWLAMNDGEMLAKGAWKQIANEIGVTPEALYREIAKRR